MRENPFYALISRMTRFDGCAWCAFAELVAEQGFPPDMEAVRRRAYAYYKEELAKKISAGELRALAGPTSEVIRRRLFPSAPIAACGTTSGSRAQAYSIRQEGA